MASRKGISPIIAAVLLVAVSLGVVGVFSGWAPQLIQTLTEETSNTTQNRIECDRGSIEIMSAAEDGSDTVVTVRNRGRTDLNVSVAGFSGDILQNSSYEPIGQGQAETITLSGTTGLDQINAFTEECGSITDTTEQIS